MTTMATFQEEGIAGDTRRRKRKREKSECMCPFCNMKEKEAGNKQRQATFGRISDITEDEEKGTSEKS